MFRSAVVIWALAVFAAAAQRLADEPAPAERCAAVRHEEIDYVVCRFDSRASDVRLFLNKADGAPYGDFDALNKALAAKGERLVFAMNAGMYAHDRSPVGLYVEDHKELKPLNTNEGPGNFHLLPNGVFFVTSAGAAGVLETKAFKRTDMDVKYATQSGPMLVIDGKIHPRFLPDSDSLKRRNGVGVTVEGEAVFVIADSPARFYDFATFFRDELKTPNALYLDGTISRVYAPALSRDDPGVAMGPIIGVVEAAD